MLAGMRSPSRRCSRNSSQITCNGVRAADWQAAAALVPAKMRYWDLFVKAREMTKDQEAAFTRFWRRVQARVRGAVHVAEGAAPRQPEHSQEPRGEDLTRPACGRRWIFGAASSFVVVVCALRCLPTTASSGRTGFSSSPSTFSSRIAISSDTSRLAARRWYRTRWGFTDVELERDFLKIGRIGLRRLAGVFPDGTPFRMPDDDPFPPPIDIGNDIRDQRLQLAVPLRRSGELEVCPGPRATELVRQGP